MLLRSGVTGSGGLALWEIMTGRLRTHFKTLNLTAGQGVTSLFSPDSPRMKEIRRLSFLKHWRS